MFPTEPPRLELANLPTPVIELKNLARDLGVPRILMKRDDLTGLETSGNKIRKLEYVVADALASGADTLVTHGGFQSNHCRATAAIAARLGLRCRLILRAPSPQPELEGNLLLDSIFGAEITYHAPDEYRARLKDLVAAAMEAERRAGRRPYFFPVGASIPLGTWGYVRCFDELLRQLGPSAKVDVYSAVSSAGTHAGLMVGKALSGADHWRVVGVPVSDSLDYFRAELRTLTAQTVAQYKLPIGDDQLPIDLLDGFIGPGYAIATPEALDAIRLLGRREGIPLDPTYTSKAFAGFLHAIRTGHVRPGAVPLFIHTGGVFGLMARRDLFNR
jgi:D-cysteine desulfhydrase